MLPIVAGVPRTADVAAAWSRPAGAAAAAAALGVRRRLRRFHPPALVRWYRLPMLSLAAANVAVDRCRC